MSQARFAAITSSLLARKGEAVPWSEQTKTATTFRPSEPSAPPVEARTKIERKKYVLRLSPQDYERLGILAVKRSTTRQHLLQEAMERLFKDAHEADGGTCACLRGGGGS